MKIVDIDFVITWVDGSDVEWQKKKAFYKGTPLENADVRFRDWDILRYWFRAVEEYAPWVHKIFFVTDNQCPEWLNREHPKLVMVDHKDFIPMEFLPTFNSHTIELNLHKIQGLSEYFIYFNDDTYINEPISPKYYFREGKPCDASLEHIFSSKCYFPAYDMWGIGIIDYCNIQVLNAHFNRKAVIKENRRGWFGSYLGWKYQLNSFFISLFNRKEFQHFYTPHNEKAFLKSVCQDACESESEMIANSCTRFRENVQVSAYYYRYWHLASNKFYPTDVLSQRKTIQLRKGCLPDLERMLFDPKIKSLCLNDSSDCTFEDYQVLKPQVVALMERKFPKKSNFEK